MCLESCFIIHLVKLGNILIAGVWFQGVAGGGELYS